MKKKTFLTACVGAAMGLLTSCGARAQMPEGRLLSIEYVRSGMMAGYEYHGLLETTDNGDVLLTSMTEKFGEASRLKVDEQTLQRFRDIIKEEQIYNYARDYSPPFEVLDGYGWHLYIRFEGGKSIESSGHNATPGGEGLTRLRSLMTELVKSEKAVRLDENRARVFVFGR